MVFEDVDMRKRQMLEELLPSLRCGKQGSKIMVTTNNRHVASIATEPIKLKALPPTSVLVLLQGPRIRLHRFEENPRLAAAGKAIVRKLNGSFFGAKIVGGMLRAHPNPQFWCKVLRSNIGGLSLLGDGLGPWVHRRFGREFAAKSCGDVPGDHFCDTTFFS